MNTSILTLPFDENYGGVLQAFALQYAIKSLGHNAVTADIKYKTTTLRKVKLFRIAAKKILKKNILIDKEFSLRHINRFISENISTTKPLRVPLDDNSLSEGGYGAFVVGSDQIWNPANARNANAFFLEFLRDSKPKRVSYAASFGRDDINFSPEETLKIKSALKLFDAISVREKSAVEICRNLFGAKAQFVSDPTMLLDKAVYTGIVEKDEKRGFIKRCESDFVFAYILDKSNEKSSMAELVSKTSGRPLKYITPSCEGIFKEPVYRPISEWLQNFRDAKCIFTDSFHGCVFSIIFNKPFLAIGNRKRGLSRFETLFESFGIDKRFLLDSYSETAADALLEKDSFDWTEINKRARSLKTDSLEFLKDALS